VSILVQPGEQAFRAAHALVAATADTQARELDKAV